MRAQPLKVLQIEDDVGQARLLQEVLAEVPDGPIELELADRLCSGVEKLKAGAFDVVLLDLGLPDSQGLATFDRLHSEVPGIAIIVLSGLDDEAVAIKAMQSGAQDYLVKGQVDGRLLVRAIRYAVERKRAEKALADERDLLGALIESLPDHIYVKDLEGRFVRSNSATARFFRLADADGLIGKTDFDLFPWGLAQQFHEEEQRVLQSGVSLVNREACITGEGEEPRWVLTTKVPFRDHAGRIVGTVGINRDVTSMKKAEEELRAANAELARSEAELQKALNELQKAHNDLRAAQLQLVEAEKLQTVGRLAAGVAHEVKNPLAVTLRGIDYLSKVLVSKDAAVSTVLHDMQDAIRRADNVIRGMLDFAAPREIDAAPQDVNNIIERALQLVKHDLDRYRVFVDKVLDPRLPRCRLDRQKAQEVFLNIFENAIHAMPSGGTLTVRTYRKTLTGLGTNVGDSKIYRFKMGETIVVVEVEDTGVGIPADKLDKLFDPFFTTKPAGQGTGLGLSVSKTIVELHGGTIDIRNRPEGGARVVVMFKADKESEVAAGRA